MLEEEKLSSSLARKESLREHQKEKRNQTWNGGQEMAGAAGCLVGRAYRQIPRDHADREPLAGERIHHGVKALQVVKSTGVTVRKEEARWGFVGLLVGRTLSHY